MVQGQRWLNLLQIIFFGNYTGEIGMWCVNYLRKCKWIILLLLYGSKLTKTLLYQFKWSLISIWFHFSLLTWQKLLLLTFFRRQSLSYYFLTILLIQFNQRIFCAIALFDNLLLYDETKNIFSQLQKIQTHSQLANTCYQRHLRWKHHGFYK